MNILNFFCLCLSVVMAGIMGAVLVEGSRSMYDPLSVGYVFVMSMMISLLSFHRSIFGKVVSVIVSVFVTQRIIVTYLFPERFDYHEFVNFTREHIQYTALFFLCCTAMILAGVGLAEQNSARSRRPRATSTSLGQVRDVSYFLGIEARVTALIRTVCIVAVPLYIYKFYSVLFSGLGMTGRFYESTDVIKIWIQNIPDALSLAIIFGFFYYKLPNPIARYTNIGFGFVIANGFVMASKSVLIALLFSYWVVMLIAKRSQGLKFHVFVIGCVIFSLSVVFPVMTMLRTVLISAKDEVNTRVTMSSVESDFLENAFIFSNRINMWEPTALWLTIPRSDIPFSASLPGEVLSILNRVKIGQLIPQPEQVDLSKLMVVMGRGYGHDQEKLGGGGENVGVFATAWLYFGFLGCLYFCLWSFSLLTLELSTVHPLHKYTIFIAYLVVPLIGGGSLIIAHTFLWYILFMTVLAAGTNLLFPRGPNRNSLSPQADQWTAVGASSARGRPGLVRNK